MKVQNVIKQTLKKQWLLNTLNSVPKNLTAEVIHSSTKFKNKKIPEKEKKKKETSAPAISYDNTIKNSRIVRGEKVNSVYYSVASRLITPHHLYK